MSSSLSSTIITTSSSPSLARHFVSRVIEHATEAPLAPAEDLDTIPWTIDNKYYTATVHYKVIPVRDADQFDKGPPALIYVFPRGKPFRDEFAKLHAALDEHDFEVSLAAIVTAPGIAATKHADEDDAEAFFSEYGFEFIDGDALHATQDEDRDDRESGGIDRVVDALSTIIWPDMTRKGTQRASRLGMGAAPAPVIIGPGRSGEEDALLSFLSGGVARPRTSTAAHEMAALERWLEEEEPVASPAGEAPPRSGLSAPNPGWTRFSTGSSTFLPLQSPTEPTATIPPLSPASTAPFVPQFSAPLAPASSSAADGFEDDFSDFVTAPSDVKDGYNALQDSDDDEGMPSQADIRSTSTRIFGPQLEGDAPRDVSSSDFDLSAAFSTLQTMRDEIGAIKDEDERRRAAARVALGFAYGLDIDDSDKVQK